jgi:glycosyltransferase involved in cell wall biosynthesis
MTESAPRRPVVVDREIVLDICHLSLGFRRVTPVGVDRVDASFAAHFLSLDVPNRKALLLTPVGPRAIRGAAAWTIFESVQTHWGETQKPEDDSAFSRVRDALGGLAPARASPSRGSSQTPRRRRLKEALRSGFQAALLHAAAWHQREAIGVGAVYLNVSQYPLWVPSYFRWLYKRPDVKPVFMIHDLLPIEHPEFFRSASIRHHAGGLSVFARIGAGVIVSSRAVADPLLVYLEKHRRESMPILIQPLPVSPVFHEPREHDERLAARPYFVICGTIEPRKNHLLLLNLWRELVRSFGPATPKLVIAGGRGWENENIVDMLERCPEIRNHVIEAPGLSTPSLKRLFDNARAVLMPSFAEGYGLPVAEALASGTPVVASDLPSFRAMNEPGITRLNPLDGLGWLAAIRRLSREPPHWRQTRPDRPRDTFSGAAYFQRIEAFLATL